MRAVRFFVEGYPYAKQSYRVQTSGTTPEVNQDGTPRKFKYHAYTPDKIRNWERTVSIEAISAANDARVDWPIRVPVEVCLIFYLNHQYIVDCENLSKAVNDGLKVQLLEDDSLIGALHTYKVFPPYTGGKNGVYIEVRPLPQGRVILSRIRRKIRYLYPKSKEVTNGSR